jgi:CDP-paratose 2-epimerase
MKTVLITGSAGLIGSEAARHFAGLGLRVVGVDNDMRKAFFGGEASTAWNRAELQEALGDSYMHLSLDIRNRRDVLDLVADISSTLTLVIHTAAQPSHDWAAKEPFTDFDINAVGTLNLLEATRLSRPDVPFIFTSTNKVYGDTPNSLPLHEFPTRLDLPVDHELWEGIKEDMTIDASLHSLFGASKVAADVLVQEYGRYFSIPTVCFRGGTLTGPAHSATRLHGFLGYVMRCTLSGTPYEVIGYGGKQVRDAIHSEDLVRAFEAFWRRPQAAAVYNIGGGRTSNVSVLEAIEKSQAISGRQLNFTVSDQQRTGDHRWWITDNAKFKGDYPEWSLEYDVDRILTEIYESNLDRWLASSHG